MRPDPCSGQTYAFGLTFADASGPTAAVDCTVLRHDGRLFSTAGAVPEPSTWAMLLIGFAGIGYVAPRRDLERKTV